MKNLLTTTLAIALFAGATLADGQMGSGGCNGDNCPPPPPPCTENCNRAIEGDADGEPILTKVVKGIARYYFLPL